MRFFLLATCLFALSTIHSQTQDYFQQEVNYEIEVSLDDKNHFLNGFEKFEYINNSPDTLHELVLHLWPNAYKNSKTAMAKQKMAGGDYFMLWAPQKDRGYIDSLSFTVNGKAAEWENFENYEDIAVLFLDEPLAPGKRLTVSTPFRVKLPSGSISRLGHVGESYQITQWYVKPAVYDMEGWHEMPYLTQGEFFSEYGSFDVKITLPENYIVGATGDLQTESEIKWMDELSQKPVPARIVDRYPTIQNNQDPFPASSSTMKTLHYRQKNVHDFGWFADKRWVVRKGETELPYSKRKVTTWALFTARNADTWDAAATKAIHDGLYYYSQWTGDYPYNQCTAVDGTISAGGGMEYPNVTVIGNASSKQELATVIIHEVGHNWFYGILGSNERDNAWMDEGINSFFETRTMMATNDSLNNFSLGVSGVNVSKALGIDSYSYQYLSEEFLFLLSARGNKDQPIQMPSDYFTNLNYGTIVYKKTAIAFNYLMNYLGEDVFNKCMTAYFEKWKFKHPQPKDIEAVFEETSGKNLDWFFGTLIQTKGKVDYKACRIKKKGDEYDLTVYNKGDIASPFAIDVIREGKIVSRTWVDGYKGTEFIGAHAPGNWFHYRINAERGDVIKLNNVEGIPEYDKNNNTIRTKGMFRRAEPYKFKMLTSIDDPEHSQVFWIPLVGWNNYNKWMVGLHLHNQVIPARNFNWSVTPLFSLSTLNLNGYGKVETYNGKMGFGIRGQRFAYNTRYSGDSLAVYTYRVISPYVRVNLFPSRLKKDWSGELKAEWLMIGGRVRNQFTSTMGEYVSFENEDNRYEDGLERYKKGGDINHIRISAEVKKKMLRSELRIESSVEGGEYTDYGVMQQHAVSYDYVYRGKGKKKIRNRLYFGQSNGFALHVSGQRPGYSYGNTSTNSIVPQDYAYDGLFLGRTETQGLLSQQFLKTQGGLAAPTRVSANQFLATYNFEFDLPVKLPIGIYGGIAMFKNKPAFGEDKDWHNLWNAGVTIPVARNIFQVYLPIVYSKEIQDEIKNQDLKFGQTIMFELNLNLANPLQLARNFDL